MQKCLCKKVIYLKKATLIISIRHRVYCFVTINAIDQVVLVYTVGTHVKINAGSLRRTFGEGQEVATSKEETAWKGT